MRDNFRELMAKEVTRKQFLQLMAGGLLSVLGFSNFLKFMTHTSRKMNSEASAERGFGSRRFGA